MAEEIPNILKFLRKSFETILARPGVTIKDLYDPESINNNIIFLSVLNFPGTDSDFFGKEDLTKEDCFYLKLLNFYFILFEKSVLDKSDKIITTFISKFFHETAYTETNPKYDKKITYLSGNGLANFRLHDLSVDIKDRTVYKSELLKRNNLRLFLCSILLETIFVTFEDHYHSINIPFMGDVYDEIENCCYDIKSSYNYLHNDSKINIKGVDMLTYIIYLEKTEIDPSNPNSIIFTFKKKTSHDSIVKTFDTSTLKDKINLCLDFLLQNNILTVEQYNSIKLEYSSGEYILNFCSYIKDTTVEKEWHRKNRMYFDRIKKEKWNKYLKYKKKYIDIKKLINN